jgi:hypothetical protein
MISFCASFTPALFPEMLQESAKGHKLAWRL